MKYQVIMMFRGQTGNNSSVLSFNCEKAAKKAEADFNDMIKSCSANGYCRIFSNPQTVESIFLDLLKANPFGEVTQLMSQAEAALKLLERRQ